MKIDTTNCSWEKLVILAKKCGFFVSEGAKHTRVENKNGALITTIPRKNRLNKYTVRGIIDDFKKSGYKIPIN